MASHLSATGQVLIDQRIRRHFSVRAGKGLGATAISRSSNRLLPNRCYRSELLCEAPDPAVLNGALSHSRECRNLTLLSPCVATRQPRPALTFRAELGICGRRLQATRAEPHRLARLSPTLSGKPQNPTNLHASARTQSSHQRTTLHPRGSPSASEAKAATPSLPESFLPRRHFGLRAAWITVLPRSASLATTKPALDGR